MQQDQCRYAATRSSGPFAARLTAVSVAGHAHHQVDRRRADFQGARKDRIVGVRRVGLEAREFRGSPSCRR